MPQRLRADEAFPLPSGNFSVRLAMWIYMDAAASSRRLSPFRWAHLLCFVYVPYRPSSNTLALIMSQNLSQPSTVPIVGARELEALIQISPWGRDARPCCQKTITPRMVYGFVDEPLHHAPHGAHHQDAKRTHANISTTIMLSSPPPTLFRHT